MQVFAFFSRHSKKNLKDKILLYEKHGVPEYWVIQPEEHIAMVYKINDRKRYDRAEIFSQEDKIPLTLKEGTLEIDLETVF